jgi:Skp family chaperone for outer membrane proteins
MEERHTFFTCPYCNAEYTKPIDLAHCILSCEEKEKIDKERQHKEKLEAEKTARKTEIETKEKELHELIRAYIKDYGSYQTNYNDFIWRMFL